MTFHSLLNLDQSIIYGGVAYCCDNHPHSNQTNKMSPVPEIEDILTKYKNQEENVNAILKEIDAKHQNEVQNQVAHNTVSLSEAKERNKNLLRDLETVKGNLRSKAIFSPTEMQWEDICQKYLDEPALVTKTWKCNLPIFV